MIHRARSRGAWLVLAVAMLAVGADASPMLHEQIADDLKDDLAMKVALGGNLPAAIETRSGLVFAPDPRRPVLEPRARPAEATAAKGTSAIDSRASGVFVPDTDTRRPGLLPYDEPFTPSTAPFKRVAAFDAVDSSYRLYVSRPERQPLGTHGTMTAEDEAFFADIVVHPTAGRPFRIPSVGPGARVLAAHLGAGAGDRDVDFKLWHDGADNWFIEANEGGRLVMEVSIPRAVFGGEPGESISPTEEGLSSSPYASLPKLPSRLAAEARRVVAAIGVDPSGSHQTVRRLVEYFRSFAESDEGPTGNGSIYLDLALSKKGVCRHRAYAFMITALSLGIPARMGRGLRRDPLEAHRSRRRRGDARCAGKWIGGPVRAAARPLSLASRCPEGRGSRAQRGRYTSTRSRCAGLLVAK
jgi:transglutaminase-like putative cysteine protease